MQGKRLTEVLRRVQRGIRAALENPQNGAPPHATEVRQTWTTGLAHEIEFWDRWFATKGGDWPEDYRDRLDPQRPLQDYASEHLAAVTGPEIDILDIGAGPLTALGKRWDGRHVRITAIDALADAYDRIMERHAVTPPVRTTWCDGELLTKRFAPESFDFVWAQNSLDHCYDPAQVIENALVVVKPGRRVVLSHNLNEAEAERYVGLHQWNFCAEGDDFLIWNKQRRINMTERLRARASVRCTVKGGDYVVAAIEKAAPAHQ